MNIFDKLAGFGLLALITLIVVQGRWALLPPMIERLVLIPIALFYIVFMIVLFTYDRKKPK